MTLFLFFKIYLFIYLTERETQRESEHKQGKWERENQASRWAGSLMWGSIPEPWDHDLSWRQTLNDWATQALPHDDFRKRAGSRSSFSLRTWWVE